MQKELRKEHRMQIEFQILDFIQDFLKTDFGDVVMPAITRLGNQGSIWILLTIILLLIPKTRNAGIIVAGALLLEFFLCNGILKPLVARTRPYDIRTDVLVIINKPKDFSFPSGHTGISFAAASALYFCAKRAGQEAFDFSGLTWLWKIAGVLALLIAFSRLYLYVHFPTDVLGGAVLGIFCGWLSSLLIERVRIIGKKSHQSDT